MEYRGNYYLTQIVQNVEDGEGDQIDSSMKGTAFLIVAVIQVVLTGACYWCGSASLREDQEEEEREMQKNLGAYQRVEQNDPNQIMSY